MRLILNFATMQIRSATLDAILMHSINLISVFSIFLIVIMMVVDMSD